MEKWRNGEKGIEEKINRHIQYERKKRRSYQTLTNSIDIFNKQMQCNVMCVPGAIRNQPARIW